MSTRLTLVALLFAANFATAHEEIVLDPITVEADSTALVGNAQSASVGVVGREELSNRNRFFVPAKYWKRLPASSSLSIPEREKQTNIFCVASISITEPIFEQRSPECR